MLYLLFCLLWSKQRNFIKKISRIVEKSIFVDHVIPCLLYMSLNYLINTLPSLCSTYNIFYLLLQQFFYHSKRHFFQLRTGRTLFTSFKHAHKHPFWSALSGLWNYIEKILFWFLTVYSRLFLLLQTATSQNVNLLKMNLMLDFITKWSKRYYKVGQLWYITK